ncbi:hypothetical protein M430DRAFT_256476 [Amorphotheca resinae ATCC 22711]|jgi:hypothetical protein|uniref:Uncharacterized protein n=1 Tax=Amorphotheca resinae ATCC 22711 TaxID=857342 RepID=A0A2T3AYD2_AMORE|nr:hypothetical protein M430DRAFT_256476 [Amorphotheca resinae ATCC 22711]PSS15074.1 hypothetical protein M430DRAFT_256476 [Amorphotheca resinae ATCC 22711]
MPRRPSRRHVRIAKSLRKNVDLMPRLRGLLSGGKPSYPPWNRRRWADRFWLKSRLEEVTRQLDRIKRAQSYQEDTPLSPRSSLASAAHLPTPSSTEGDGLPDPASAFGLDQLDLEASQVSAQSLESYYLTGTEILKLFREYETTRPFSGSAV